MDWCRRDRKKVSEREVRNVAGRDRNYVFMARRFRGHTYIHGPDQSAVIEWGAGQRGQGLRRSQSRSSVWRPSVVINYCSRAGSLTSTRYCRRAPRRAVLIVSRRQQRKSRGIVRKSWVVGNLRTLIVPVRSCWHERVENPKKQIGSNRTVSVIILNL